MEYFILIVFLIKLLQCKERGLFWNVNSIDLNFSLKVENDNDSELESDSDFQTENMSSEACSSSQKRKRDDENDKDENSPRGFVRQCANQLTKTDDNSSFDSQKELKNAALSLLKLRSSSDNHDSLDSLNLEAIYANCVSLSQWV